VAQAWGGESASLRTASGNRRRPCLRLQLLWRFVSPFYLGEQLKDIKGKKGYPLGQEMMQKATEGEIKEVTYWWPRPGSDKPLEKTTFYTKVGDQICSVGYYKD
jgi:Cache domain